MFNSNENVRRSLERTFKIICSDKILGNIENEQNSSSFENKDNNQTKAIESPKHYILKILLSNMPDSN